MGNASFAAEKVSVVCHVSGEEDLKFELENVNIEVAEDVKTFTDATGRARAMVHGPARVTVNGYKAGSEEAAARIATTPPRKPRNKPIETPIETPTETPIVRPEIFGSF